MDEHLNERHRFSELYCPTGEYEEHIEEEIKAIEKKLLGTGPWAGDWFRDPADHSVIFSAINGLPIRDEDHYVVVLHCELEALSNAQETSSLTNLSHCRKGSEGFQHRRELVA